MPPSRCPGRQPGAKEAGSRPLQLCTHYSARAAQRFRNLCKVPRTALTESLDRRVCDAEVRREGQGVGRFAWSHARVLGFAESRNARRAVIRCRAKPNSGMPRSICTDRNLLGSKRVLPLDWGARGARLFRGQASSVTSRSGRTSDFSFAPILAHYAGCRPNSPDESSPVVLWRWSANLISRNLGEATSRPLGAVIRWIKAKTR